MRAENIAATDDGWLSHFVCVCVSLFRIIIQSDAGVSSHLRVSIPFDLLIIINYIIVWQTLIQSHFLIYSISFTRLKRRHFVAGFLLLLLLWWFCSVFIVQCHDIFISINNWYGYSVLIPSEFMLADFVLSFDCMLFERYKNGVFDHLSLPWYVDKRDANAPLQMTHTRKCGQNTAIARNWMKYLPKYRYYWWSSNMIIAFFLSTVFYFNWLRCGLRNRR